MMTLSSSSSTSTQCGRGRKDGEETDEDEEERKKNTIKSVSEGRNEGKRSDFVLVVFSTDKRFQSRERSVSDDSNHDVNVNLSSK